MSTAAATRARENAHRAIARAEARAREVAGLLSDERLGDAYPYVSSHRARQIREEIEADTRRHNDDLTSQ